MKQFLMALFIIATLASCDTKSIVEFPNGSRVSVENTLYDEGDKVCVVKAIYSDLYGSSTFISTSYWKDTVIIQPWADGTWTSWDYRMGIIIER